LLEAEPCKSGFVDACNATGTHLKEWFTTERSRIAAAGNGAAIPLRRAE